MLCTLSLLLSVCLLHSQPVEARDEDAAPRERRGVVEYIRAGLGITTTTTATYFETTTIGQPAPTPSNANAEDFSALATCAASWSSYDILSTASIGFTYVTYTATTLINTTLVYGTGDVYTSYGKIPVASGEFTPTRTVQRMLNISTTTSSYKSITYNPALITETPACSFTPKDCSRLYVSYISSLGLPHNASVPKITPSPENSPKCPDYYYKPYTTTYASTDLSLTADCKLYGNSVELFYFPSRTAGQPEPTTPVTYEYKPGTTFTSPSIYLSFDYISATRYIPLSVASYSASCGSKGCVTIAVGGGDAISEEGSAISGQILTMAPTDVSSIVLNYGSSKESGVISTVAGNLPGYGDVAPDIYVGAVISQSLKAERLRIEDLVHPPPRAYYLRPEGAPGCGTLVHSPECGTIFEGAYRAIISLPSEVSLLQGAWSTCNPAIYGVYDPPIALTEAASVAKPTLPPGYQTTPASSTANPYTITPPLATSARTALRDTLPSSTGGRELQPESTHVVPSAVPSNSGGGTGGHPEASSNGKGEDGGKDSNTEADDADASTPGGTAMVNSPDETVKTLYNSGGSATATLTSDRRSTSHDSTASDKTGTAKTSGSDASSDASSSTSPADSSQAGSSICLSKHLAFSVGGLVLAIMF